MNLFESFRFAWRGVTANKGRSALTMLGVLIGVASVIALVAVGNGASATVTSSLNSLGSNTLTVTPGASSGSNLGTPFGSGGDASDTSGTTNSGTDIRAVELDLDDARALADKSQAPDVLGVAPVVSATSVTATYRGASHAVGTMTGSTAAYLLINNDTAAVGRTFTDSDYLAHSRVALVGPTVAKDLVGGDGNAVLGRTINLNGNGFTVIGILTAKGSTGPQDQDDRITAPATAVQDTLAGYQNLSSISVKATSAETTDAAQAEVERILQARHGTTEDDPGFTVSNSASILSAVSTITSTFTVLLGAIAGISLLVGGIGVMNIMLVTVTERTREIGIRKAIGAGRGDIITQFLVEAVMLSMLGGVLGILLGSLVGLIKVGTYQPVVSTGSIVLAFSFSVAIGLIFGLYPANRAASLKPIDALRYE
ncbi:ABC transporter permease [uncultured Friedmanniella sp.]|uniref:ABC transporter permease n=1 Tax=uncultured Friedmanniella sp. TaxID=335381 RepID=UPI0035C9E807